jgi:hypothetical protein
MKNAKDYLKEKGWKEGETGMFDLNGLASTLQEYAKDLQHHKDTTVGLWATDRPDLIDDPKKLLFEIKG